MLLHLCFILISYFFECLFETVGPNFWENQEARLKESLSGSDHFLLFSVLQNLTFEFGIQFYIFLKKNEHKDVKCAFWTNEKLLDLLDYKTQLLEQITKLLEQTKWCMLDMENKCGFFFF